MPRPLRHQHKWWSNELPPTTATAAAAATTTTTAATTTLKSFESLFKDSWAEIVEPAFDADFAFLPRKSNFHFYEDVEYSIFQVLNIFYWQKSPPRLECGLAGKKIALNIKLRLTAKALAMAEGFGCHSNKGVAQLRTTLDEMTSSNLTTTKEENKLLVQLDSSFGSGCPYGTIEPDHYFYFFEYHSGCLLAQLGLVCPLLQTSQGAFHEHLEIICC